MSWSSVLGGVAVLLFATTVQAQARLNVENHSERQMAVKVMRVAGAGQSLHATTSVAPFKTQTVYFSETGDYFLKTMATLDGREPVYQRGAPFRVYNGRDGYSVLTVKFTIKEAVVPEILGGEQISRQEFERDSSNP